MLCGFAPCGPFVFGLSDVALDSRKCCRLIFGSLGPCVIASQRVRPEVAGPMTSSAKQSKGKKKNWICSVAMPLAMATQ